MHYRSVLSVTLHQNSDIRFRSYFKQYNGNQTPGQPFLIGRLSTWHWCVKNELCKLAEICSKPKAITLRSKHCSMIERNEMIFSIDNLLPIQHHLGLKLFR